MPNEIKITEGDNNIVIQNLQGRDVTINKTPEEIVQFIAENNNLQKEYIKLLKEIRDGVVKKERTKNNINSNQKKMDEKEEKKGSNSTKIIVAIIGFIGLVLVALITTGQLGGNKKEKIEKITIEGHIYDIDGNIVLDRNFKVCIQELDRIEYTKSSGRYVFDNVVNENRNFYTIIVYDKNGNKLYDQKREIKEKGDSVIKINEIRINIEKKNKTKIEDDSPIEKEKVDGMYLTSKNDTIKIEYYNYPDSDSIYCSFLNKGNVVIKYKGIIKNEKLIFDKIEFNNSDIKYDRLHFLNKEGGDNVFDGYCYFNKEYMKEKSTTQESGTFNITGKIK